MIKLLEKDYYLELQMRTAMFSVIDDYNVKKEKENKIK